MEKPELVEARHQWLLERVGDQRRIHTNEAAAALAVSVDTIRRDLRSLHRRGLLRRVHGGAVPFSAPPSSFRERQGDGSPNRPQLALAVIEQFKSGQVIGLDAGSTNAEIAALLPQSLEVTVVTNNPAAAVALADHRSAQVVLIGGTVDLRWMAVTGSDAVDSWRNFRLDIAVLGACGFDPLGGASTQSLAEVATKRALVSAAACTLLPLDPEKFGAQAPFHVVDAKAVDRILTTSEVDDLQVRACQDAGTDITIA